MGDFLLNSLVLSVGLTIIANLGLILWRRFGRHEAGDPVRASDDFVFPEHPPSDEHPVGEPRTQVRVFFPWKAMVIGSIVLTVLLNMPRLWAG